MDGSRAQLEEYLPVVVDLVLDNLHLYAITIVYWALIASFLGLRYALRRRQSSDRLRLPIVAMGVSAALAAGIDVLVRGEAGLTHVSLVAYLATPVGVGRYFVATWDRRKPGTIAALAMRLTTYGTGFVSFVTLSALEGTLWPLSRPGIDRSSAEAIIHGTEWMPFMATVLGLMLVADAITSIGSIGWNRTRAATRIG